MDVVGRAVGTLVNFLEALMISWVIVLGAYGFALLAMHAAWWTVRFASWAILYATFGVTLLIVHSIWWMIRSLAQFGRGANNIQSSKRTSHSAIGREVKAIPSPRLRPSFPDVAISVTEAREALLAYERRAFTARSEIRETVTRTLDTIAQTQALMAHVEAVSRGVVLQHSRLGQPEHEATLVREVWTADHCILPPAALAGDWGGR